MTETHHSEAPVLGLRSALTSTSLNGFSFHWEIKLYYRTPSEASHAGDAFLNPNFFSHLLLSYPGPPKNSGFLGKWLISTYYKTLLLR